MFRYLFSQHDLGDIWAWYSWQNMYRVSSVNTSIHNKHLKSESSKSEELDGKLNCILYTQIQVAFCFQLDTSIVFLLVLQDSFESGVNEVVIIAK